MGNNLAGANDKFNGTTLLENIISDKEVEHQYPIYTLANHRKKGLLIDTYMLTGKDGVKKLARELLPKYVNNGCKTNKDQVNVSLECQIGTKRCWRLEDRGILGESLLHVLVFSNTPCHTAIAQCLLELYPNMALDVIEGEQYFGASALHLSIVYGNYELTRQLLQIGADVNQRATGRFFQPEDQKLTTPKKHSNFQGLCYLGEYPLFWAACCEDETSYNLLLKHRADPNMEDSFGNMVLHVIVVADKQSMYGYALKHPTLPAKDDCLNKYGLTPLTLACKLGRNDIFREMLELRASEIWRFSTINCSCYPLAALDSLLPNGKTNWNSALLIILGGNTNEHLDMLDGGVIQRLLEEKWKTFARKHFLRHLSLILVHLATLSIAVYLRQGFSTPLVDYTDIRSVCRFCAEIGTCIGCLGFVIIQPAEEILAQGIVAFFMNLLRTLTLLLLMCVTKQGNEHPAYFLYAGCMKPAKHKNGLRTRVNFLAEKTICFELPAPCYFKMISNPPKSVFLVSSFLILLCVPCRLTGDRFCEDMLLSIALPGSWFFLMFFAGAVRLTGPFVTMIYSILSGDMFRFSIIYFTFLLAFTQAFYFLFKNQPAEPKSKRFRTYLKTWISIFQMTLGNFEYDEFRRTVYYYMTQMTFALFLVFMPILLLNMLIAMMGNTYCQVIEQSEKEWVKQWAKIVVALERAISQKNAREYIESYSISFASDKNSEPQRAVMVIRRQRKSKAKQRKGALKNWKRLGRKVIFQLKKHGDGKTANKADWVPGNPKDLPLSEDALVMPGLLGEALNQIVLSKESSSPADMGISKEAAIPFNNSSDIHSPQFYSNLAQITSSEFTLLPNITESLVSPSVPSSIQLNNLNCLPHRDLMLQPDKAGEKTVNSAHSFSSEAFVNGKEKKSKRKKRKKRRDLFQSKIGPMEQPCQRSDSESDECSWTIGVKVERRNPRTRAPRKKKAKEGKEDAKYAKERKSKQIQFVEDSTEQGTLTMCHSVKQKGFSQRSSKNVVAMASLVAWEDSEDH